MNAAAWIALVGAALVVLTNVVVITRFLSTLEGQHREFRAQIKGELDVIRTELKALLENTHATTMRMGADHGKLERQHDIRLRDLERIVGRSTNLRELQD
jgi:hypothetical protein